MSNEKSQKIIASRIKKARLERNYTQAEIAFKLGLNVNYYARLERGLSTPSMGTFENIIKVLKVKSSDILPY